MLKRQREKQQQMNLMLLPSSYGSSATFTMSG